MSVLSRYDHVIKMDKVRIVMIESIINFVEDRGKWISA